MSNPPAATPPAPAEWTVGTITAITQIESRQWDLCAGLRRSPDATDASPPTSESMSKDIDSLRDATDSTSEEDIDNPFISFAFLSALEESGCVGGTTGWHPAHQIVRDAAGHLVAAAPAYVKAHSRGEYVFDHGWAEAYERAGGRYYPKIQVAVPFTPVTGPRLLVRADVDPAAATAALAAGLRHLGQRVGASSVHATFLPEAQARALEPHGYLLRNDQQYHWANPGYASFDEFLASLSSRKRKMIRRERKDAVAAGITLTWRTGRDITEADWDAFFAFYMDTGSRKWGHPYLNRRFFSLIGERMADRILLVFAERAGKPIGGAINFIGKSTLYGRNWGTIEDHPFLHFEACYYQAMDFAIAHGLSRVEAGAQGEHKLLRGYRPVLTWSAHAIADPGLQRAVARFLEAERRDIATAQIELDRLTPFRRI